MECSLVPHRALAVLILAHGPAIAQLQLTCTAGGLDEFVGHARQVLAQVAAATGPPRAPGHATATGQDVARIVLGHLRLGCGSAARACLQQGSRRLLGEATVGTCDPVWLAAAHVWYARSTQDRSLLSTHLPPCDRLLTKLERDPLPLSFAAAALQVHARYCVGMLRDLLDRERFPERWQHGPPQPRPGCHHRRIATERWLQLECLSWQPGRGHYRPQRSDGEIALPVAADASLLVPNSAGMLIASGNRFGRHLRQTLACADSGERRRWQADVLPRQFGALSLCAASQLGASTTMAANYTDLLAQRTTDPALAALQLDAMLFAITGMRIAIGAGIDDNWLRFAPWLPPNVQQLEVRGLLSGGRRLRLELRRTVPGGDSLQVRITMTDDGHLGVLPIVVGDRRKQFLARLEANQPFACELSAPH